jgi:hypothetical protein
MQQFLMNAVAFGPDFFPIRAKLLIYYGNSTNIGRYYH